MKTIQGWSVAVALAALIPVNARANLIANGDFESGNTDWLFTPNAAIINAPLLAHSGDYFARLGSAIGGINQVVNPTPGAGVYKLEFWARDTGPSGSSQTLAVMFNNKVVENFDPTESWTLHSHIVNLSGIDPTQLLFYWLDGNASAYIDDISLVAVPEPATVLAGALLLFPVGLNIFRTIRNRRAA